MDSLDGFQSERKEVDRKAEEEKKVKVGIIIKMLVSVFHSQFFQISGLKGLNYAFFFRLLNMTAILKG